MLLIVVLLLLLLVGGVGRGAGPMYPGPCTCLCK